MENYINQMYKLDSASLLAATWREKLHSIEASVQI